MFKKKQLSQRKGKVLLAIFGLAFFIFLSNTSETLAKVLNLGELTDSVYVKGNLGVGTDLPTTQLQVGADAINPTILLESTGSGDNNTAQSAGIEFGESTSARGSIWYTGDGYMHIGMNNRGREHMRFQYSATNSWIYGNLYLNGSGNNTYFPGSGIWNSAGKVGIGTNNPTQKLDVSGIIKSNGFTNTPVNQVVKQLVWSRIVDLNSSGVLGTSFIVNITGTRSGVVWNSTWQVTTSHNYYGYITLLSSSNYSQTKLRLVVDSNGNGYLEFYDQANGAVSGANQTINISLNNFIGTSNVIGSFLDGTDTTGYTVLPEVTSIAGGIITQGGAQFIGSVGIGTTAPTQKLHVNGGAQFDAVSYGVTPGELQTSALVTVEYVNEKMGGGVGTGSAGQTLRHDGTSWVANSLLYNNGTNIGIGTTAPTAKLNVVGTTYFNGASTINGILSVNSGIELSTGSNRSISYYGPVANNYFTQMQTTATTGYGTYGPVTSDWAMYNRFNGANTRGWIWQLGTTNVAGLNGQGHLQIAGNFNSQGTGNNYFAGNVGIGTTNPTNKFEVQGGGFKIQNGSSYFAYNGAADITFAYPGRGSGGRAIVHDSNNVLALNFAGDFTGGTRLGVNTFFAASSGSSWINTGNVGIGTTNPVAKLDILGTSGWTGSFVGSAGKFIGIISDSNFANDIAWDNLSALRFSTVSNRAGGAYSEKMRITNTGSIGIGTTAPTQKLHVNGGAQFDAVSYGVTPGELQTSALVTVEYVNEKMGGGVGAGSAGQTLRHDGTSWVANPALYSNGTNVGIGTTNPTTKLYVNGTMTVAAPATFNGGIIIKGNLEMDDTGTANITGVEKITANVVDPLYNIKGTNYSTFAPAIAGGLKEEYVGRIPATAFSKKDDYYEAIIDLAQEKEGSDLWVWYHVVEFNDKNVEIFLAPRNGFASTYSLISGSSIIVRSDRPVDLSIRLVGSRFDWRAWPTKPFDQTEKAGLIIKD